MEQRILGVYRALIVLTVTDLNRICREIVACSDYLLYNSMTPDDEPHMDPLNHYKDSAGESPGHTGDLWTWDQKNLAVGEYVGFPLYQQLRDRLCHTSIPAKDHNRVIMHMIDMHDDELVNHGIGCSTLVCGAGTLENGVYQKISILEASEIAPFVDVTNWKDMI